MTEERKEAIDALNRIFNYCEEIDHHCPEDQRTGYKMYPDILKIHTFLHLTVSDLTERDIPKARFQTRCGVCDLWLNECDWGDEDFSLSESGQFKYCPRCGQRIDWEHDDCYDERKMHDDKSTMGGVI